MRTRTAVTFALLGVAIASQATGAATAWFGLNVPQGLSDPDRPVVDVARVHAPAALVPAGEERFDELRGERIRPDVAQIVEFSRKSRTSGDRVWGRVTGFPSAKATIDWAASRFKEAGLRDVAVQEYVAPSDSPMWWATSWEARVIGDATFGAGSRDVVLQSAVPTSGSMIEGASIKGPLVFVGAVTDPALAAIDVKGKIVVQHLKPERGAYSERRPTVERAQALAKRGALAVINVIEQTGNMHIRDFGNCGVPCFNVGTQDGAFVKAAIARAASAKAAPVQLELKLAAKRLTGLKGHNAFGIVPGKAALAHPCARLHSGSCPSSDENIIVNAHADGWYDAAGDNADGLAVLIAMARHFAKPENTPERTLVFVASGGHHSTGLNGPANFVKANPALTGKTVMVLNLEHIAQFEIVAGSWTVNPREQPMNFGIDNSAPYLQALGQRAMQRYGFNLNPTFTTSVAGDLGGYSPLGVARVQAIHSGPMYHASGDVLDTISVPGLERAARFYTYFIAEAAKASRAEINPPKARE